MIVRTKLLKRLVVVAAVASMAVPALAASLSGQEGAVKHRVMFTMDMVGGCAKMWQRYVAASGHSAFAVTPTSPTSEGFICGANFNAGSQAAAEKTALGQCNAGLKRWKINAVRLCVISASK